MKAGNRELSRQMQLLPEIQPLGLEQLVVRQDRTIAGLGVSAGELLAAVVVVVVVAAAAVAVAAAAAALQTKGVLDLPPTVPPLLDKLADRTSVSLSLDLQALALKRSGQLHLVQVSSSFL